MLATALIIRAWDGRPWRAHADSKKDAREERVEVEEADAERGMEEKAVEFGANPDALKAEFEKRNGRQRLNDMLLAKRMTNFLIDK